MEQKLNTIIEQTQQPVLLENYKNPELESVELTDEELQIIIRAAKYKKLVQMKEKDHWEKVNKPVQFETISTLELGILIRKKAKAEIPNFSIDEENRHIFKMLCQYFNNDLEFEENEGFSLNKGLLLFGPIGCGKTSLMRLFGSNPYNCFVVKSARQVADDYTDKELGGANALNFYSNPIEVYAHQNFGQTHAGICFDDLGTERNKKHFGNEVNPMQDIILNRYDKKIYSKTHFTTNLSADEISEVYGSRVRSRLREMCNMITFSESSIDRRK